MLVTLCWWPILGITSVFYVDDQFLMLVPRSWCSWRDLSPTSKTCYQLIWSPTSITITCYCPDGYILDRDKLCLTTRMQLYIWWRNFSHWKQEKLRLLVVYLWKWKLELSKWPRSVYWQQEKESIYCLSWSDIKKDIKKFSSLKKVCSAGMKWADCKNACQKQCNNMHYI